MSVLKPHGFVQNNMDVKIQKKGSLRERNRRKSNIQPAGEWEARDPAEHTQYFALQEKEHTSHLGRPYIRKEFRWRSSLNTRRCFIQRSVGHSSQRRVYRRWNSMTLRFPLPWSGPGRFQGCAAVPSGEGYHCEMPRQRSGPLGSPVSLGDCAIEAHSSAESSTLTSIRGRPDGSAGRSKSAQGSPNSFSGWGTKCSDLQSNQSKILL